MLMDAREALIDFVPCKSWFDPVFGRNSRVTSKCGCAARYSGDSCVKRNRRIRVWPRRPPESQAVGQCRWFDMRPRWGANYHNGFSRFPLLLKNTIFSLGSRLGSRKRRPNAGAASRYWTKDCRSTVFDSLIDALPPSQDEATRDMAMVNSRARLRMTTLYYFAAQYNCLVLGTGNKVEDFGIGFYTKYGDGVVDLSPIADLNETEVYALGRELGISEDILQAAPTDGLWVSAWHIVYCPLTPRISGIFTSVASENVRLHAFVMRHRAHPIPGTPKPPDGISALLPTALLVPHPG